MKARPAKAARRSWMARRTVAGRLLASFILVLAAFAITIGWSFQALSDASREADVLRTGYVPLSLRIGEALAAQSVLSTQLNHITTAKNPSDVRDWIETARRARPLTFARVRKTTKDMGGDDAEISRFGDEIIQEVDAIEALLGEDGDRFAQLFQALSVGDNATADRLRNDLVKLEAEGAVRLRTVKSKVETRMEQLTGAAEQRERRAVQLLVGLGILTLLVGAVTSLYARRVLRPLTLVTERAKAVAEGDLTPREAIADGSEIGELATTFEGMVDAIRRARSELVHAERLAAIGKMAAHITHEIRNPLSSMGLNIELLEEELALDASADKEELQLVNAIKGEASRLSRIAEQYLSVARRPAPQLESESVEDLLGELLSFVRLELDRARVTYRLSVDDALEEVKLDESQFRQAMLNLIRNAREAMADGGHIDISVRRAQGGGTDVIVEDNGPGIPDDARASIFDPFFTTKQRGTGLGLAVTRDIVEAHGGVIACEAAASGGTRFRIHLPEDPSQVVP